MSVEVGHEVEVLVFEVNVECKSYLRSTTSHLDLVVAVEHTVTILVYETDITRFRNWLKRLPVPVVVSVTMCFVPFFHFCLALEDAGGLVSPELTDFSTYVCSGSTIFIR